MRNILSTTVVAGLAAVVLAGGVASAQTVRNDDSRNAPRHADWMSIGEIVAKVEGQGYRIREIEIDDGLYEIKAIDTNGMRVEVDLDPVTGEPVRGWREDD